MAPITYDHTNNIEQQQQQQQQEGQQLQIYNEDLSDGEHNNDTESFVNGLLLTQRQDSSMQHIEEVMQTDTSNDAVATEVMDQDTQNNKNNHSENSNNVNTDDESVSETSSVVMDEAVEMTLTERRAHNIQRNYQVLTKLGMMHNIPTMTKKSMKRSSNHVTSNANDETATEEQQIGFDTRGMILPTCFEQQQQQRVATRNITLRSIQEQEQVLYHRYPHRSIQIRKLYSLLSVAISSSSSSSSFQAGTISSTSVISPPIIVTGPSGCGKTSIVRDVVEHLRQYYHQQQLLFQSQTSSSPSPTATVLPAYVDCHTLDQLHIDSLLSNAYHQWEMQLSSSSSLSSSTNKGSDVGRKQQSFSSTCIAAPAQEEADDDKQLPLPKREVRMRRAKTASTSSNISDVMIHKSGTGRKDQNDKNKQMILSNNVLTTIWMFGRSLQRLLYNKGNTSLILIIDQAELLISSSMGSSSSISTTTTTNSKSVADKINLFVQLMLLPRTMGGFHLTVIFITKNILLEHVALNNMGSYGTIQCHICPITIHFPAYRGKATIQTILLQEYMKSRITGQGSMTDSLFYDKVYKSFLETLIQALSDLTSNMNEFVRLGRGLWPLYISPLRPDNIKSTMKQIRKSNVTKQASSIQMNAVILEREVLSFLDQRIFPQVRLALDNGLGVLSYDSSGMASIVNRKHTMLHDDMPLLMKYLLLAVYICHANRQDKDKQLFSIERNGRKRRKTKEADHEEETAYGTVPHQDQPKTIRPRTFPLERLYSLFVSIVSLNVSNQSIHFFGDNNSSQLLQSLGGVPFLETITYLRDIGVLHDFPKRSATDPIRFSQRYFWTSITRDEVQSIATSINFPLDRYIM